MTTTITTTRTTTRDARPATPSVVEPADFGPPLAPAVATAARAAAALDLDDPRWEVVGPLLTAFVDAGRRAAGLAGSSIGSEEIVAPVLRLRDLGRLAERTASSLGRTTIATSEVEMRVRSLQVAVFGGPGER